MKRVVPVTAMLILGFLAVSSIYAVTEEYGWEDGGTILGQYGNVDAYNVGAPDPVLEGNFSLKLVDMSSTGPSTPQAYLAWVTGLQDGDLISAGFWRYDLTPSNSPPSVRIWAHYTSGGIDDYAGSAGGNDDYGLGTGWEWVGEGWIFDAGTDRTGIVIEARTYSNDGDTVWLDALTVTAPEHATIHVVPEPATIVIIGLGSLALRTKRRS